MFGGVERLKYLLWIFRLNARTGIVQRKPYPLTLLFQTNFEALPYGFHELWLFVLLVGPTLVILKTMVGSVVDYVDSLMGGGFKIENPNASSSCGCGSSFKTEGGQEGQGLGKQAPGGGCAC